jgi:hypothetical protein
MNLLLVKFLARASRSGEGELAEVSLVPIQEILKSLASRALMDE